MGKIVAIVHTSLSAYEYLNQKFREIMPEVKVINIVDESLLYEAEREGNATPAVANRLRKHYQSAEEIGACLVMNQCASMSEAADQAAALVSIPVLRVDTAMVEKALEYGKKVGVVVTARSSLRPALQGVQKVAAEKGIAAEAVPYFVEGAWEAKEQGNKAEHDRLLIEAIRAASEACDVVILAQGSMMNVLPKLGETRVPVLANMDLAVMRVKEMLS